ncbi:MAG: hypothetical protein NVS3B21_23930 [Acidimicrobiales bacterium]
MSTLRIVWSVTSPEPERTAADLHVSIQYQLIEALQEREHDLAEAQRLAHLGSWSWDLASGKVTWSQEMFRIFGLEPDEFVPSYEAFFSRVHPEHRARIETIVQKALTTREEVSYSFPILLPDGEEVWVQARARIDVDGGGAAVRMHGTVRDGDDGLRARAGIGDALTDPLTGLASRALLVDRARRALARAARTGGTTALLLVDVDDFRGLNDLFGQDGGDELLVETGQRLDRVFRPYDTVARPSEISDGPLGLVARFAGDQFVVVCEHVGDTAHADILARRVTDALSAPMSVAAGEVVISAGIGIALAAPGELTLDQLIWRAETALRRAKAHGPGGCEVFTGGPGGDGETLQSLQRALAEGEFRLVYQPKVALDGDRIVGVEALLRWDDPARGVISPLEFIPLAEETGMIVPIGAWVIEQACGQARRWLDAFPDRPPLCVSVNVSVRQFGSELTALVSSVLASSRIPPESLCIEVTESILMADLKVALGTLHGLAELGVRISIDDFGTGFSSLAYLRQFPIHELKIDKSFVDGLGGDPHATAIVSAVISMAHALDLDVVAEGVETADQLARLRTLGCNEAQGYFFARPGEPGQVDELVRAETGGSTIGSRSPSRPEAAHPSSRADRVLVVDDSDDVRQLALMSLSAHGFEVYEASDGTTALATARAVVPDCVVLDVMMPDMSGFEVCAALRADPDTSGCTILMLSANDDAQDKMQAFSCGADDYIVKPFSPRDLTSRVHAAMGRRRSAGVSSDSAP